jgi:hypothetical protein
MGWRARKTRGGAVSALLVAQASDPPNTSIMIGYMDAGAPEPPLARRPGKSLETARQRASP